AGAVLRALSGCRGLAINWLIVGIVGLRYLRSRDTRENGIVRAGPFLISLCGHHIRPHRFGLVAPAFPASLLHAQNEIAPSAKLRQGALPVGRPRCG
ncbi:MAG: hypothetical protein WBC87_22745, partial [Pseudolabrys sp.]